VRSGPTFAGGVEGLYEKAANDFTNGGVLGFGHTVEGFEELGVRPYGEVRGLRHVRQRTALITSVSFFVVAAVSSASTSPVTGPTGGGEVRRGRPRLR
jgi:hypothetical protein